MSKPGLMLVNFLLMYQPTSWFLNMTLLFFFPFAIFLVKVNDYRKILLFDRENITEKLNRVICYAFLRNCRLTVSIDNYVKMQKKPHGKSEEHSAISAYITAIPLSRVTSSSAASSYFSIFFYSRRF